MTVRDSVERQTRPRLAVPEKAWRFLLSPIGAPETTSASVVFLPCTQVSDDGAFSTARRLCSATKDKAHLAIHVELGVEVVRPLRGQVADVLGLAEVLLRRLELDHLVGAWEKQALSARGFQRVGRRSEYAI